jgi:hypothetical protein
MSNIDPETFGLKVRPRYLSPPGDLGGVCICELLGEWGLVILEMKIGEGGAVNVVEALPWGFAISCSKTFINLSVVLIESHFKKS